MESHIFNIKIGDYKRLITGNPIFLRQVEGRGFVRKKDNAIDWGLSKPLSRASEVEWDLRNKG